MEISTLACNTKLYARMYILTFKAYGIATLSTVVDILYQQLKLVVMM